MKSKLFLGLSLLTAVFSMNASFKYDAVRKAFMLKDLVLHPNSYSSLPKADLDALKRVARLQNNHSRVMSHPLLKASVVKPAAIPAAVAPSTSLISSSKMLNAKLVGIVAAPSVAVAGLYTAGSKLNSYMNPEVAPKLTYLEQAQQMIQNGYNSVKANAVKGYNSSLTFVKANPKSTAGAVAAVAALGYVAYNSDLFGKSKAPVVTAPVAKAPVAKAAKRHLGAF